MDIELHIPEYNSIILKLEAAHLFKSPSQPDTDGTKTQKTVTFLYRQVMCFC